VHAGREPHISEDAIYSTRRILPDIGPPFLPISFNDRNSDALQTPAFLQRVAQAPSVPCGTRVLLPFVRYCYTRMRSLSKPLCCIAQGGVWSSRVSSFNNRIDSFLYRQYPFFARDMVGNEG
jgi:hypothetical protein